MAISDEMRKAVIEAYYKGISKKDISINFGIRLPTVYAIVKVYLNEGRFEKKLKGGERKKSLSEEHVQFIREKIQENCSYSLKYLKQLLLEKFQIIVCETTINRYIDDVNITIKSVSLIPEKRNEEQTTEIRSEYAENFMDLISRLDETNLYFVDEVGFNISMRCKRGRSPKGTRAIQVVPGIRNKNVSVCCAMSKNGVEKYTAQMSAFNIPSFAKFIDEMTDTLIQKGIKDACLIMDNVKFHKNIAIKEIVEEKGFRIMFLPPYSPFLNPIENMFSKWKQFVRSRVPKTESELIELISSVDSLITSSDCSGYYRHMLKYIPRCIQKVPIND